MSTPGCGTGNMLACSLLDGRQSGSKVPSNEGTLELGLDPGVGEMQRLPDERERVHLFALAMAGANSDAEELTIARECDFGICQRYQQREWGWEGKGKSPSGCRAISGPVQRDYSKKLGREDVFCTEFRKGRKE